MVGGGGGGDKEDSCEDSGVVVARSIRFPRPTFPTSSYKAEKTPNKQRQMINQNHLLLLLLVAGIVQSLPMNAIFRILLGDKNLAREDTSITNKSNHARAHFQGTLLCSDPVSISAFELSLGPHSFMDCWKKTGTCCADKSGRNGYLIGNLIAMDAINRGCRHCFKTFEEDQRLIVDDDGLFVPN